MITCVSVIRKRAVCPIPPNGPRLAEELEDEAGAPVHDIERDDCSNDSCRLGHCRRNIGCDVFHIRYSGFWFGWSEARATLTT